jgi:hypothetical protein
VGGNWEAREEEGMNVGPEAHTGCEVDMDDDVCIELNAHQKKERYNRQRE